MRSLSGDEPPQKKPRPDMRGMTIANMHADCNKCFAKALGCDAIPNTLGCVINARRFKAEVEKAVEEKEDSVDKEMEKEERKAIQSLLNLAATEAEDKADDEMEASETPSSPTDDDEDDD